MDTVLAGVLAVAVRLDEFREDVEGRSSSGDVVRQVGLVEILHCHEVLGEALVVIFGLVSARIREYGLALCQ